MYPVHYFYIYTITKALVIATLDYQKILKMVKFSLIGLKPNISQPKKAFKYWFKIRTNLKYGLCTLERTRNNFDQTPQL